MPYASVDSLVRISSSFRPELPDGPIISMFGIKEGDETVEGIAVSSLRIGLAGTGTEEAQSMVSWVTQWCPRQTSLRYDNVVCHVAEIQACLGMLGSGTGDDLPQERGHCRRYLLMGDGCSRLKEGRARIGGKR